MFQALYKLYFFRPHMCPKFEKQNVSTKASDRNTGKLCTFNHNYHKNTIHETKAI